MQASLSSPCTLCESSLLVDRSILRGASTSAFRFERLCHSERSEESRPGPFGVVCATQSKSPRGDENVVRASRRLSRVHLARATLPGRGAPATAGGAPAPHPFTRWLTIFIHGGGPKAHEVFARNDMSSG